MRQQEKKSIYSIKNIVNGKEYIGVTKNPSQRWGQHVSAAKHYTNYSNDLYKDMNKLGVSNFTFQILEEDVINHEEREQWWIKERNTLVPNGYNISIGGTGGKGVDYYGSGIRSTEKLLEVVELIKNTKISFDKIAERYAVASCTISDINTGKVYRLENEIYPLRETRYSKELFKRLVYSLKYETEKSMQQIAKEYNVDMSQLSEINQGNIHRVEWLNYPIRKGKVFCPIYNYADEIIDLLINTNMQQKDIAKKYNVAPSAITNINLGRTYKREGVSYPIRINYQEGGAKRKSFSPEEITEIEVLLRDSDYSMRKIAAMYGTALTTITNLNNGVMLKYKNDTIEYPIRKV